MDAASFFEPVTKNWPIKVKLAAALMCGGLVEELVRIFADQIAQSLCEGLTRIKVL
jgi:hypothetical protein